MKPEKYFFRSRKSADLESLQLVCHKSKTFTMGPRKGSKKQPPSRGGGGNDLLGSPGDSDGESNGEWSQQTEQEKRKVIAASLGKRLY